MRSAKFGLLFLCAAAATPLLGDAQPSAIERTILQKADLSAPGREAVVAIAEMPPGIVAGRHTHAGEEIGYVLEGTAWLLIDGQSPREVKEGESFIVPSGVIHDAKVIGERPGKVLATFIVEKGKPLATPVQ